ncbi:MAG: amino acid ABC transporter ATP-binding protein, partial [Clostridia bacterium]|nr:amino acid ABC transporter ATP-binding protein [Clostridia bacterium]
MIFVENLEKKFGDLEVLKGINEHISVGEVIAVIGPSGSGKSTFLRCLNLLEEPTDGTITIDGDEITKGKININRIREKMGMVFQQFNLFPHLSVLDNITLSPIKVKKMKKEEAVELAYSLLEKVGLRDKAEAYPAQLSG